MMNVLIVKVFAVVSIVNSKYVNILVNVLNLIWFPSMSNEIENIIPTFDCIEMIQDLYALRSRSEYHPKAIPIIIMQRITNEKKKKRRKLSVT